MAFLTGWTPRERHAVIASYLGWALDAFDFFVLVFVLSDIATSFQVAISGVALALTLTLAIPPAGRFHLRPPCRSLWPPSRADGQYRLLFAVRISPPPSRPA